MIYAIRLPWLLPIILMVAACGRPLTDTETAFMATLTGDTLDPAPVRIAEAGIVGLRSATYPVRPRTTCRERILPPPESDTFTARTAGVVLFNRAYIRPDWFLDDYMADWPEGQSIVAAMFFAHEMIHVWQWQNRELTGYHPLRAASEHVPGADPYLFDPDETRLSFLEFGYEQQASLVEEFVCCRALDPEGARTERLAALLSEVMPIARLPQTPMDVRLPWDGAETRGICS